ncbi:MAG: putative lipid II flippase FtsW [Oscillospiraceae bacterium]|nr:putative lipid II flippase FtsW [Oscillospiraceae bacterium]MBQ2794622.1 putative lipid II flippase FtsW [Oscillospiraceae bacterium]MBQ6801817.1 putative lipid II flippase FtsW [Oscillospiraceae bacterium]
MKAITIDLESFIPVSAAKERIFEPKHRRGKIDVTFLVLVLILLTFGLVMLFSASYAFAFYNEGNSFYYIERQLFFAVAGVAAMLFVSQVNYKILQKYSLLLFAGSVALLLIADIFMRDQYGFARWIYIGSFSFQPSEIAKFAIIVLFAHFAATNADKMQTFKYGVLPFGICLGTVALLVILSRHLSGTIIILALGIAMMWFGGTKMRYFAMLVGAGAAAVVIVLVVPAFMEYAGDRVTTWLDPYSDPLGEGFQTIQSLIAIGSGGLWGTGLGNSRQKYLYIPEPQNDFIFPVVCEELGFIGASLILILFALLIFRGYFIAMHCSDKFGALLAAGCITHIGLQVVLNIAVVTGTIPNTGISLPLFSYGGTALLMTLGEMGVVLSVSKKSAIKKN